MFFKVTLRPLDVSGGVILVRKNNTDINTLSDLNGKVISTTSLTSFSSNDRSRNLLLNNWYTNYILAFMIQADELLKNGFSVLSETKQIQVLETPYLTYFQLLNGTVDAQ